MFEIDEFTPVWQVSEREFKRKLQERLLRHRERGREQSHGAVIEEEKNKEDASSEDLNIFLAGFPPVGNLVPFNIKEHTEDAVEIMRFYSYNFPPIVEMHEDVFEIPHDELWFSEKNRLFLYIGKYPEVEYIPKATYKQAEVLAKIAKELLVKELYTIGVIVLLPEERDKFGDTEAFIASFGRFSKEIPSGVKKMSRREMGNYTIVRKTGLLPGFASKLNIESYAILGVGSRPNDIRACIRALRAFKKITHIKIDEKVEETLEKNAKVLEEKLRSMPSTTTPPHPPSPPHPSPSPPSPPPLYGSCFHSLPP